MTPSAKIDANLLSELSLELNELDAHDIDPATRFIVSKARELYWTTGLISHAQAR